MVAEVLNGPLCWSVSLADDEEPTSACIDSAPIPGE